MMIKYTLLLLLISLILMTTLIKGFQIENILSPSFKKTLIRTLQIDKEDWKKELEDDKYNNNEIHLNTRQKRLFEQYKQNMKKNTFGWNKDNEIINGRLAMISFFAMFIIEEFTDESILEQIGILEHGLHLSLYMLISFIIIQPMIEFFDETKK